MTLLAAIFAAAVQAASWYPAPGWAPSPDPAASPSARKGGTLRFNGGQPPKSYNAYVDGSNYTRMTFELMYSSLIAVDSRTLDFVPHLAERWSVSEDGGTFVFVLDGRARWSDLTPVTAADVKWTFDRVMDPKSDTGSWKAILGDFESPEIRDDRTVVFRKKNATAKDWRSLMHVGFFSILPRHAFEGKEFNRLDFVGAPVSSAYCLERVEEQIESVFRRSENWWRAGMPSSAGLYNFDRIVMRYYSDNENAFEAFKKRLIDVYPVYSARIMAAETSGERFARNWMVKRRVKNHSPIGFQGFAMNMRRAPFDRLEVRQAMAKLLDRETMNRTLMNSEYFLLKSYYTDLYGADRPCANRMWEYDVEGAKELLAKAGLQDGFSFTFLSRSAGEDKFLSLFDQALAKCNVKMKIVRKDFASWMRDMDSFNFDMTWAAWGAGIFRNPEPMWHSAEGKRQGGSNITGFASGEVDEIIAAEKGMMSAADREEAYRKIDRLVSEAVPYVLLWHTDEHRLLYWNKFGMPSTVLSRYGDEESVLTHWWYDLDRALELKEAMAGDSFLPALPLRVGFE